MDVLEKRHLVQPFSLTASTATCVNIGNGPSTTRNGRPRRTDSQTFPLSYVSDGEVSLNVQRDSDQFPFRNEPPESTAHPGASMLPSKQMSPASSEVFPLVGNSLQDSSSFYKDGPLTPGPHVRGPFNVSNGGIPRLWTPFILRREVLIPLTCLFVLVIIVLEVLFYLSNRHLGLSTSDASKHYLWTYGPTASLLGSGGGLNIEPNNLCHGKQ